MALLQDVEDAQEFLDKNIAILRARRAEKKTVNLRIEPRIGNDVQTVISIEACQEDLEIVGMSLVGRTLDLSLHGMKVATDASLPGGSQLKLRLETEDGDTYLLVGVSMWTRPDGDKQLAGISIIEAEEFDLWRDRFGVNFVAPRIGRNYKPIK
jgi:hypothetical protein